MLSCDFHYQHAHFDLKVKLEMHVQLLGIVGASGSGKSTFLKNIVGLLKPESGFIQFNNKFFYESKQNLYVPMHKRKTALIFQNALLFPHMNVQQNLLYAQKLVPQVERKFSYQDILTLLNLKKLLNRKAYELSGGEAQRVSIGRALLSSPDLLLLDEPLTGLDASLKKQILPFLKDLKEQINLPIIYVTHHLEEVDYLEAKIITLQNGQLSD